MTFLPLRIMALSNRWFQLGPSISVDGHKYERYLLWPVCQLLNDKTILPDATETIRIKNKINDLSDRRSDLIKIYAIPGFQPTATALSKPTTLENY